MPIRVLSDVVAAQIAAGEVVERPASVVKELLENALDAGATSITIEVEKGGRRSIRVSDDGAGIPAEEAVLAFERHSTSKLETADDLSRIVTLGFRGEALASIASVSRVTLITRYHEEDAGTEVQIEGGELQLERAIGAPVGTVITVENLFFNVPARLKFMKAESTERRHITQLVTRYAMAYADVRFRLVQEGREQFHSTGSGDLADVLVEAFGLDTFREMIEVSPLPAPRPDLPPVEVYGFTSAPSMNRSNRSHIVLFVNGRVVSDQSLTYAVTQAYHTLMPQGRYPLAVIMIALPPEEVDVNVHPTKAEVRFRVPDAVFAAVQRAVRRAVVDQAPVPGMQGDPYRDQADRPAWGRVTTQDAPTSDRTFDRSPVSGDRQLRLDLEAPDPGRYAQQRSTQAGGVGESDAPHKAGAPASRREAEGLPGKHVDSPRRSYVTDRDDDDGTVIPAGPGAPARPRTLPIMRVIGQIGAMYIVAEGPAGLYLVDQHAAHERIVYEQFMAQQAAMQPVAQQTLPITTLEFTPGEAQLVEESLDMLRELGFDLELFGTNTFRVRAIPALLADHEPEQVLRAMVEDLESGAVPGEVTLEEKLVRRVCKTAAVKAGQVLSYEEMQGIIQQLERCEFPRTCPHGRPTMLHISGEELARQFGRT
ncbi:MAG: DNA mismatch repair endonuclease MutL [Anaerolineae bacterium]|nr:DNA mismatch repair endonuclease MutL [Anaerolineae bacterium]